MCAAYLFLRLTTPRNPVLGYLADLTASSYAPQRTQQMQGVAQLFGVPAVSQTLDRLSYGEPLTTGAGGIGGTTRVRPEAIEAAMTVTPMVGPFARMTKGLPVGMSIKDVGKSTVKKTPQETALLEKSDLIEVRKIRPFNAVEDVEKLNSLAASMQKNGWQGRPILAYDIGDGLKALTGSHRIAAAKKAGIEDIPVLKVSDDIANYIDDYGRSIRDVSDQDDVTEFLKGFGDKDATNLMRIEQKYNAKQQIFESPQDEASRLTQQPNLNSISQEQPNVSEAQQRAMIMRDIGTDPYTIYQQTGIWFGGNE
jgi:hypothetical protein